MRGREGERERVREEEREGERERVREEEERGRSRRGDEGGERGEGGVKVWKSRGRRSKGE